MKVLSAQFVTSATTGEGIPRDGVPHVAFVGRSNVGKSSLLNALAKRDLARTSAAAGKTRLANLYKVTVEGPAANHIAALQATVGRSANFSSHSICLGGALVRNDAGAVLSQGSEATLNGLYIVNGTQHIDNHTSIDHPWFQAARAAPAGSPVRTSYDWTD